MAVREEKFMLLAIAAARRGIMAGQTPFGACIVKNGRVVACAHNSVWKSTDSTAHAAVTARRAACRKLESIDLSGCEIYSTCEPCPMCFSAIHWAKMKRIIYGAGIADAKKCGFSELGISNERMKKLGGSHVGILACVMREECRALFYEFMEVSGKQKVY